MIENIRQFVFSVDFVFVLIVLGFILVVALLLLENRRDNQQLRLLNQKIKDLIAGDYSEVLDMQGSPEITDMINNNSIFITNIKNNDKNLTVTVVSDNEKRITQLIKDISKMPKYSVNTKKIKEDRQNNEYESNISIEIRQ